jgi:hypothetical protein
MQPTTLLAGQLRVLREVHRARDGRGVHVGLYKLNTADPQLESAWFQHLRL